MMFYYVISSPDNKAALNKVVEPWQTPPPGASWYVPDTITDAFWNPLLIVLGPVALLYEKVSPGITTVLHLFNANAIL